MEDDEILKNIIDSVVPYVVEGTDEEKVEMAKNIEKRLRSSYNYMIESINDKNKEKIMNFLIKNSRERYESMSLIEKKRDLLIDVELEKIIDASNKALELAEKRAKEGIVTKDEKLYNELSSVLTQKLNVKEYNKEIATRYISEGILDLNYAFGFSNVMSLRIGRWNRE